MILLESVLQKGDCFRLDLQLLILYVALAVFNGVLAAIAFSQVRLCLPFYLFSIFLVFSSCIKHFVIWVGLLERVVLLIDVWSLKSDNAFVYPEL